MRYRIRPGIVMTKIAGVNLLIPTRPASEYCPSITRLSFLNAGVWQMLEKGRSTEEIYQMISFFTKKDREEAKAKTDALLEQLYNRGCLIREEDGDDSRDLS